MQFLDGRTCLPVVKELSKREANLTWFVFSDDIPWCRKNVRKLGLAGKDVVFVEGNEGENAYIDMQLMVMCRHRIVSNIPFPIWGTPEGRQGRNYLESGDESSIRLSLME